MFLPLLYPALIDSELGPTPCYQHPFSFHSRVAISWSSSFPCRPDEATLHDKLALVSFLTRKPGGSDGLFVENYEQEDEIADACGSKYKIEKMHARIWTK